MTKKLRKPLSIILSIMMVLSVFTIIPVTSANAVRNVCPYCKSGDIEYIGDEWICYDCADTFYSPLDLDAEYTITWKNSDGTTLAADRLRYNEMPSYTHEGFTLNEDEYFTYEFTGWYPTLSPVNSDTTYYAQYNRIAKQGVPEEQSVTFDITPSKKVFEQGDIKITLDYESGNDGFLVSDSITMAHVSAGSKGIITKMVMTRGYYSGTPITLANGKTIMSTRSGEVFTCDNIVANTAGIRAYGDTYAFIKEITVYYLPPTYTVTWKNGNDVLETDANVEAGSLPSYDGTVPTKADDDQYTYEFAGWTDGTNTYGLTDTLPNVTADVTYTAVFEGTMKPEVAVAAMINSLPTEVTVNDKEAIEAARAAYDALKDEQKALVDADTLAKLTAAEEALIPPVVNESYVKNETVKFGNAIRITGAAKDGTAPYTYAYYFKRTGNKNWKTVGTEFGTASSVKLVPTSAGTFEIKVIVKDAKGKTDEKLLTAKVIGGLALDTGATLSASTIQLGESVTVSADPTGGAKPYAKYEFYYKRSYNSSWKTLKAKGKSATLTPLAVGIYDIKCVVTDADGVTAEKVLQVNVDGDMPLTNTSKINRSETVPVNTTIKITGRSEGGKSPVNYEYFFKRSTNTNWKTLKAASADGTRAKFTPTAEAEYEIKVVATDSEGTKAEKIITVTAVSDT